MTMHVLSPFMPQSNKKKVIENDKKTMRLRELYYFNI